MSDRFDFEQQMHECWYITKDLDYLLSGIDDHKMTQDDVSSTILGMRHLYEIKFQNLFNTFDKLLEQREL